MRSPICWVLKYLKLKTSFTYKMLTFAVQNYLMGGENQTREFAAPAEAKENGAVDSYGFSEQQPQQVSESENVREENSMDSNGSLQNTVTTAEDQLSASVKEPIGETQKHTYASIVCSFSWFLQ